MSEAKTFRTIEILHLDAEALGKLSGEMKLSLSKEDMVEIQRRYAGMGREPTDVELEVIAQTWSEHCKHRIFAAEITMENGDGASGGEVVDSIFKTFVKEVTEKVMQDKPGFVLSAFVDNAGFIRLNDELGVCLKAETHNHPSAIEPYAGANTGLGGVIRDILGAGLGSRPVASLDVFCFGRPDADPATLMGDTIHPLGVFRGVVRGVRDYGNRMGIPTVSGAIHFDEGYTYNPLVFCGTAGVIPIPDIEKHPRAGLKLVAVGARTGRDGLHGATFSSASLSTDSHVEDQSAVQIGNPIEEKKAADCILHARREGLIADISDCGAGGYSSAGGEMLEETGGIIDLDAVPLKQDGMVSWEIFLSESQERMVLGVAEENLARLDELAAMYGTEMTVIGEYTGDEVLKVVHQGNTVCELTCDFLHAAPRKQLRAVAQEPEREQEVTPPAGDVGALLERVLGDLNVCSREPVIREYDHEVQGNTLLKPLAGAAGDAPQDGAVIAVDGAEECFALGLSMLPQYAGLDAYRMGLSGIDEAMRQLVVAGADPDRVGLLDNFCMGNPEVPAELGKLVACCKGMAKAALAFGAPFISGKDSFYNCYADENGEETHIPVTFLASGIGIVPNAAVVKGASLRRAGSDLWLLGETKAELGGSALARATGLDAKVVPGLDPDVALRSYRALHQAMVADEVLAVHDCAEGGLAVALAEFGFSGVAGIEVELPGGLDPVTVCFAESNARILVEAPASARSALEARFAGLPFARIGASTDAHERLVIRQSGEGVVDRSLLELKAVWKNGLVGIY